MNIYYINPNKVYNRIIDLIGFLMTVLLVIGNVLHWFSLSWWWLVFTILIPPCFHADESEENIPYNKNLTINIDGK